jgi:hypothetical protein
MSAEHFLRFFSVFFLFSPFAVSVLLFQTKSSLHVHVYAGYLPANCFLLLFVSGLCSHGGDERVSNNTLCSA